MPCSTTPASARYSAARTRAEPPGGRLFGGPAALGLPTVLDLSLDHSLIVSSEAPSCHRPHSPPRPARVQALLPLVACARRATSRECCTAAAWSPSASPSSDASSAWHSAARPAPTPCWPYRSVAPATRQWSRRFSVTRFAAR